MNRLNVLEMTYDEARKFFLKQESYCNIDLPKYFSFSELLDKISHEFTEPKRLTDFSMSKGAIGELDDVNHLIYANKDGKLSWRPLQLIHPLVYVDLVHEITKKDNWGKLQARFKKFQKNKKIKCLSIPVQSESRQSDKAQQILKWWELVEQESIFLSLEYDYVFDTDVADCYGSIYTHSIAWAVESKQVAKQDRSGNRLGNFIDKSIQNAQYQQTNGIPQGSVLMDFIAEIVLGYIDRMLSAVLQKQKIIKYQILRYRDDYRIFVCNANDGEKILKLLSEIMMPLGLKLNASKTKGSQDVITQSIKKDKLAWLKIKQSHRNLQKQLLVIRQHGIEYPNSGSLTVALNQFDKKIELVKRTPNSIKQLISIVTDIAYHNPKTIPICCSIISKLFSYMEQSSEDIALLVHDKLSKMPNSGFAQIWLQRMLKSDLAPFYFSEKLCLLANEEKISLWNHDWIKGKNMKRILENTAIFLKDDFNRLDNIIYNKEIDIFDY